MLYFTQKLKDGISQYKTYLVAKGFKEVSTYCTDSPTFSFLNFSLLISIVVNKRRQIHSLDIKCTFLLEGKEIYREIHKKPPSEIDDRNT